MEFIPDIDMNDIKKRATELTTERNRITINDVLMTVLSKTVSDYLKEHTQDKETKFLRMACPFSLRAPPKFVGDFTMDNDFAIVNLNMRLVDSLTEGVKLINRDMNELKKSIEPVMLSFLIKLVMQLPEFLRSAILEDYCDKMTFGFSNVPGPKIPFVVAGKANNGIGFIMPVGRSIVGSFSIISHVNVIKIAISMDKATMDSPKLLADIFTKNLDSMLEGPKWREFHAIRNN